MKKISDIYTCVFTDLSVKEFDCKNVSIANIEAKKYGLNHKPVIFPVTVQLKK
jgi:hypothetical protein